MNNRSSSSSSGSTSTTATSTRSAPYFADDGEYTDMPTPPDDVARGPAQIAARLRLGLEPLASISHDVRVDRRAKATPSSPSTSSTGSGRPARRASLPFVSMHELRDGKIVRWWDYWDLGTLMNAAPAWWVEHIMSESRGGRPARSLS